MTVAKITVIDSADPEPGLCETLGMPVSATAHLELPEAADIRAVVSMPATRWTALLKAVAGATDGNSAGYKRYPGLAVESGALAFYGMDGLLWARIAIHPIGVAFADAGDAGPWCYAGLLDALDAANIKSKAAGQSDGGKNLAITLDATGGLWLQGSRAPLSAWPILAKATPMPLDFNRNLALLERAQGWPALALDCGLQVSLVKRTTKILDAIKADTVITRSRAAADACYWRADGAEANADILIAPKMFGVDDAAVAAYPDLLYGGERPDGSATIDYTAPVA